MRSVLKTVFLASALTLAAPALTHASEVYKATVSPLTTAVNIDIVYSEDMQYRANNLPKSISLRGLGTSRGTSSGFFGNGYYGEKSLNNLAKSLETKMSKRFAKKGIVISDDAPVTMRVTITDVKNNRPTFKQISQEPGLSFQSIAIGGAELNAEFIDQDGTLLGSMHYSYFERDFDISRDFSSVWFDANRGFTLFAKEAAKTLAS